MKGPNGPGRPWADGMMMRTAALAGPQQARPGMPAAMPPGWRHRGHGGPQRSSYRPLGAGVSRSWPQLRLPAGRPGRDV